MHSRDDEVFIPLSMCLFCIMSVMIRKQQLLSDHNLDQFYDVVWLVVAL